MRLPVGSPHVPFKAGVKLRTASGKIEIESAAYEAIGVGRIPQYVAPRESAESDPALAAKYPLALISPPAHTFLNSTFVNVASLRRSAGKPTLEIHAADAAARGITGGEILEVFNDRGRFRAEAVVTDRVQPGWVAAPSVWWGKLTTDGANANKTTSQAVTDVGGGATFYDNLVEVRCYHSPE